MYIYVYLLDNLVYFDYIMNLKAFTYWRTASLTHKTNYWLVQSYKQYLWTSLEA